MSVEIGCSCGDLPAHSHTGEFRPNARGIVAMDYDPYDVRIWVDWKAIAHDLLVPAAEETTTDE
jgi:hypothetical protein